MKPRSKAQPTRPKGTTYLVRNQHSYCFRYQIPPELQKIVGKKEIRYSLRTGYIGRAKAMSAEIAVKVKRLMNDLRRETEGGNMELPQDQVNQLITGWVRETLEREEEERTHPFL
jgi:hypothetical protein